LNQTARQLNKEGVPYTAGDLARFPMRALSGRPIRSSELPLLAAWRKIQTVEAKFILSRAEGDIWHVTWAASPVRDEKGQLLGVVGSLSCGPPEPDWQRMAELTHDLRTPLQSLRLLCALLDKHPQTDPELVRTVADIRAAADRAVQLSLDLLECTTRPVARIGDTEPPGWFVLAPFLTTLSAEQIVAAQAKGLALTTDFRAIEGWEIHTDRLRLGRVLSNLLVNAVRYTPLGKVEFNAVWRDEGAIRKLGLSVIDTGPGITPQEQDSIFQPFERGRAGKEGETARSGDTSGSGLGLAVVDRLVDELGMEIEVYSEYGRGSSFQLLIPTKLLRQPGLPAAAAPSAGS
jgi:signal transduction histidine kinase